VGQGRAQAVHGGHGAADGQEDGQQLVCADAEGALLQVGH
jgi:hypothetical protein